MQQRYSWSWVETQVARTIDVWNNSGAPLSLSGPRYSVAEQRAREKAYDRELQAVEQEAKSSPRSRPERLAAQDRLIASFARFSATALDLSNEAVQLLTNDFLPAGVRLAHWARRFDPSLSMADIVQACRNAWTACGLQPLLGKRIGITPSILGYSLLYPYSDNYLDRVDVSALAKRSFSERFRDRLRGNTCPADNEREAAIWALVSLIEGQYLRALFPQVFDCLLAIHRAQEESITQIDSRDACDDDSILRISCAKGGTSVLADACLARGTLQADESHFSFKWGTLLQLGDDLQDIRDDLERGSATLFSRTAAQGKPLDNLVAQLLNFSEHVGTRMDRLPHGGQVLKELLRMSWRSLVLGAVSNSYQFFTPSFLEQAECCSPFRFSFLRSRRNRITNRHGLYKVLFDIFLESDDSEPLLPHCLKIAESCECRPTFDGARQIPLRFFPLP